MSGKNSSIDLVMLSVSCIFFIMIIFGLCMCISIREKKEILLNDMTRIYDFNDWKCFKNPKHASLTSNTLDADYDKAVKCINSDSEECKDNSNPTFMVNPLDSTKLYDPVWFMLGNYFQITQKLTDRGSIVLPGKSSLTYPTKS